MSKILTIRLKGGQFRICDGEVVEYVDELWINEEPLEADELHADIPAQEFEVTKDIASRDREIGKVTI